MAENLLDSSLDTSEQNNSIEKQINDDTSNVVIISSKFMLLKVSTQLSNLSTRKQSKKSIN